MEVAYGCRALGRPKNRQPHRLFCAKVFSPWWEDFSGNPVGYPKPASRRPNSRRPKKSSGTPISAVIRKRHNFRLDTGATGFFAKICFGPWRLIKKPVH